MKYKPVAKKVRPQETELPEEYRIKRRRPLNPLADMPPMPEHPPDFTPTGRLTRERYDEINWNPDEFLKTDEVKLLVWTIGVASEALSWTAEERGKFSNQYFDPVKIATIPHEPWQEKNRPIAPGAREQVTKQVKSRVDTHEYEPSNACYRSNIFPVPKHDGSIRVVHDNQQLNRVSIRDAALPPNPDHIIDELSGRSIYSALDLHVAFDQRELAQESRDLTTFSSPLGSLRCTRLLMGHTNSFQTLHADMEHIYTDTIAKGKGRPYCDDMFLGGHRSRYEKQDGTCETIPGNPGIRRFVWEHIQDLLETLWLAKAYGITFSGGKKMKVARSKIVALGHEVSYEGRSPDEAKKAAILGWGPCASASDIRRFLGTTGVLRMFIRNYGKISRPLVDLTRKHMVFEWGEAQSRAMELIKDAIRNAPCLASLDYSSDAEVILGVDSSETGVGWFIAQTQPDGKRRYCRFGSATFTGAQGRYGQSKCELFGLYTALMKARFHLFGVRNLSVEHDARYLKGMVESPDLIPDATINRWIAGIRLFSFQWKHIPGKAHEVADGLSRRVPPPDEIPVNPDYSEQDEFLERVSGFASIVVPSGRPVASDRTLQAEAELELIRQLLRAEDWKTAVARLPPADKQRIMSFIGRFHYEDGTLYRKGSRGAGGHLLAVPKPENRDTILRSVHDELGHKGVQSVLATLRTRFWWPAMRQEATWFVGTCDRCQMRSEQKPVTHRTVPDIPGPLRRWHVDTKHMPRSKGANYILQARCALTGYPEIRAVATENAAAIAMFIEEALICRYGPCIEIVTDNGAAYVKALESLKARWPTLEHIRISAYNSQANGIVERAHRTLQESLYKIAGTKEKKWRNHLNTVIMAERLAVKPSHGESPFYLTHGFAPVLPVDIAENTVLHAAIGHMTNPDGFLASRKSGEERRQAVLTKTADTIRRAREKSARDYNAKHGQKVKTFHRGDLVMVRDATRDSRQDSKPDDRYKGPYVVVHRTRMGTYRLVKLDDQSNQVIAAGARRVAQYKSRAPDSERINEILAEVEEEMPEEESDEEVEEEVADDSDSDAD